MIFTPAEVTALEALELASGPTEISTVHISANRAEEYRYNAQRYVGYALDAYATYKLASDPEFAEKQRKALEEEARKRSEKQAARSGEVREAVVMGFLSGLLPKLNRDLGGQVTFEVEKDFFVLQAQKPLGTSISTMVSIVYNRSNFYLATFVAGKDYLESLKEISGNSRPRDQVEGLEAVHVYLDGLAGNDE